jgi:hypothetical protein
MRFLSWPPRPSAFEVETDEESFCRNSFPEVFAELFSASGWHLVNDGVGDWRISQQSLLDAACWRHHDLRLGIFHWAWDGFGDIRPLLSAVKAEGRRILWVCHERDVLEADRQDLRRHNRAVMSELADHIVVLNQRDQQALSGAPGKVWLVPHFMPNSFVRQMHEYGDRIRGNTRRFGPFPKDAKSFGIYGVLRPHKGIVEFARTWYDLRAKYPDWRLQIYAKCLRRDSPLPGALLKLTGPQLVWHREGYRSLPDQLGEFAALPYVAANNSGMIDELTLYECPTVALRNQAFEGKACLTVESHQDLIEQGIEGAGSMGEIVKERKRDLLRRNAVAKQAIIGLATDILLGEF